MNAYGARFWIALAVFQLGFALLVFSATRAWYEGKADATAGNAPAATPGPASPAVELPDESSNWEEAVTGDLVASLTGGDTDTNDPEVIARRANDAFNERNYALAAEYYERLLAFDTTNADVRNNLALTLHYVGRSAEALEQLRENVAVHPEHQRSWLTLGFVSRQLGDEATARDALTRAVEIDPDDDIGRSAKAMLDE